MAKLKVGEKIPDFLAVTVFDGEKPFSSRVGEGKTAIIFLRYYGCTLCQYDIYTYAQNYKEIVGDHGKLFVVLQSKPETIKKTVSENDLPFQIICDPQEKLYKEWGNHFIHAGDEWYILAERPIPEEKTYDGYLQLENGVGMVRLLEEEVAQTLAGMTGDDRKIHRTIATGELAAPFLRKHVDAVQKKYPNVDIQVLAIKNEFFGGKITVAGLITGTDLISQLKGKDLGDRLLLTNHMLKSGEPVFLDDVTVDDVQNALQIKVSIVESSGNDFVNCILNE